MLQIKNLCAGYGNFPVLREVSLSCKSGTITTVIGANGCGKSTLLKSAVGLSDVSSGEILLDGRSVTGMRENLRAQNISYLAQGKNVPDVTVENLVLHGRFPYRLTWKKGVYCAYHKKRGRIWNDGRPW